MPTLHGRRGDDGIIQIDQRVKFNDLVQSSFFEPWGTQWFVDGDNGNDSYNGRGPAVSKETIQAAVTAASAGDTIYIRPKYYKLGTGFARYEEDIVIPQGGTAGSGETATKANITLIGITARTAFPSDHLGVRLKYATNTPLNIEAPGTHIENIGIFAEGATYAIFIESDGATRSKGGGDGSSIYNCAIKGSFIHTAGGSSEIQIVNCRFQAKYDGTVAGINFVGSLGAVARPLIENCDFLGGNANNMSGPCIKGAAPIYDAMIRNCYFGADPDGSIVITFSGSNTGHIHNCYFAIANVSTDRIVEGGMIATGIYDGGGLATGT